MRCLLRTHARPRWLACIAALAALAGVAPAGDFSDAAQRLSHASIRRVWPVALTGLVNTRSRFCRLGAVCGVGDLATAIDANGGGSPSVYYRDGLLYVWFVGGPERAILVVDRAGRVVRTVRGRTGSSTSRSIATV